MNRKDIFKNLSNEELNKLHSALGTVSSILNPHDLKLSILSELGLDDAFFIELFELDVLSALARREKECLI